MTPPRNFHTRNTAYSLVEVLTVIAVLAILVAISTSIINKASRNMKEVRCIKRMQQTGVALLTYAADHQSRIPPRIEPDPENPGKYLGTTYWFQVLRTGGYTPAEPFTEKSVHICPEYATTPVPKGQEAYGLRRWRSPGGPPDTSQNLLSIENPSDFFILACSVNTITQRQGYCIDGYGEACVRSDIEGRVKTLFADGHVQVTSAIYFQDLHLRQADYHVGNQAYRVETGTPSNY